MPTPALIERAELMLADLPPYLADEPTVMPRTVNALAKELDRLESHASMLRLAMFPHLATDAAGTLAMWEDLLGLPVKPGGVNEIQQVTVTGSPTGGSFQLIFNGQTAVIQWNSTAAQLQTQLEGLSNLAPGDVYTLGGPFPATPITVEFRGTYAAQDVPAMTLGTNSLTGGSSPSRTVTTPRGGMPPVSENIRRQAVIALTRLHQLDSGQAWVEFITRALGGSTSWTHTENDPSSYTLHIDLSGDPDSYMNKQVQRLLRIITPAHLGLNYGDIEGFVIGESVIGDTL